MQLGKRLSVKSGASPDKMTFQDLLCALFLTTRMEVQLFVLFEKLAGWRFYCYPSKYKIYRELRYVSVE